MKYMKSILLLLVTIILSTQFVHANTCVHIDESKDSLSASERIAALSLLELAFQKVGVKIKKQSCKYTYKANNIRLGSSITASIKGPKGIRSMQIDRIEDLGNAYEQMVHSLLKGSQLGDTAGSGMTRHNVSIKQAIPTRVENDSVVYIGIGPGYILGSNPNELPISFNVGYRYELDSFGLDVNLQLVNAQNKEDSSTSTMLNLSGIYFLDPVANHSLYFGGGLGLGAMDISTSNAAYMGDGLHLKAQVGYEFFRVSTLRLMIQFDVTLPFYNLEDTYYNDYSNQNSITNLDATNSNKSMYAPTFGLSLNLGWSKKPRSITVRNR